MKKLVVFFLILCAFTTTAIAAQQYFNDRKALAFMAKYGTKGPDPIAKIYLYELETDTYTRAQGDEFEMKSRLNEAKQAMQNEILDPNEVFYIASSENLGPYDFDAKTFELKPMTKNTFFKLMSYSPDQSGPKSKGISINFANPGIVTNLPMAQDRANDFIKARKDEAGNVNRKVFLKILFNVTGVMPNKDDVLTGTIISVEVYEDSAASKLLYVYGEKVVTNAQKAALDLETFINNHTMPAAMQNELWTIIEKYK